MNYQFLFWILVASIFFLFELGHPGLFLFLSFFFGALCALSAYFFEFSFNVQLLFMMIGTVVSLLVLCFVLKRTKQLSVMSEPKTNMYSLQGKQALVIKEIVPLAMGEIKVDSALWAARSLHQTMIPIGSLVEIVTVKGCHCLVKQIK